MTTEERLNTLEQALDRTQNSLRRTRWALGACVLAGLAGLVAGAARDNGVVSARAFVVVDGRGRALARLGDSRSGGASLKLADARGRLRVELAESAGGPFLHLDDEKGTPRAALAALAVGPALTFRDVDGHVRLGAGDIHDEPNLSIMDESGRVVWKTR